MPSYPRDLIDRIRGLTDIVELVGSYVPLQKSGRSFKACCPFHDEKTPSFHVNPERQIFKCFGCGEGGDAIAFVMRHDRLEFAEAIELLAERCGVTLEQEERAAPEFGRRELLRAMDWAARTYRAAYGRDAAQGCREYVAGRGIEPATVEAFGLGYSPPGGTSLVDAARRQDVPARLLELAGLAAPSTRDGTLRDRFWDARLVFPIRDPQGRVVAFGGRSLDGSEPKYLNTPETALFHKGRMLYGLERLARDAHEGPILVVEGYTDVILPVQCGVEGVVATLGTALTSDHARLLARYSEKVVLVYDGDRAGLAAAERGGQVLLQGGHLGLQVSVLPEGRDPCDLFQERGPAARELILEGTRDLVDFLVDRQAERTDGEGVAGRTRAAHALLDVLMGLDDPVGRDLVLGRIASRLGLALPTLSEALEQRLARRRAPRPEAPDEAADPTGSSPRQRLAERAQMDVLEALLNRPELGRLIEDSRLAILPDARLRSALESMLQSIREGAATTAEVLGSVEDPDLRRLLGRAIIEGVSQKDLPAQLEGGLACLENMRDDEAARAHRERGVTAGSRSDLEAYVESLRARKVRQRKPGSGADSTA